MANVIQRFIEIVVNSGTAVADLQKTEQALEGVDTATTKVEHSTNKLTDSTKKHSQSVLENGGAVGILNELTGGLASTFKDASEAVGLAGVSLKTFRGALIATGLGAFVVVLGLVINNFDKVKEVALKLVPGLQVVADVIGSIVEAVTDFIGVTSDATRAVDTMRAEAEASIKLNKKFLDEHGSQLDEFTKQKIAAKDEYNKAIQEDGADQVALAKELNRKLAAIEHSRGDEARAIQAEEAEKTKQAKIKREEQERKDAEKLAKENADDFQKFQDAVESAAAEGRGVKEKEKQTEKERVQAELDAFAKKTAEEEEKQRQDDLKADKAVLDQKIENKKQLIESGEQLLANVKALAGKNKTIQKAAVLAEGGVSLGNAIKNTSEAVTKDLAKGFPANVPLVALDIAVGATSIASIIQGTNKALQAIGAGGGSPSGSAPSAQGGGTPAQFNIVGSVQNQIGQNSGKQNTVVKAQVVSSEVTNAQSLDRNRVEQSVFL